MKKMKDALISIIDNTNSTKVVLFYINDKVVFFNEDNSDLFNSIAGHLKENISTLETIEISSEDLPIGYNHNDVINYVEQNYLLLTNFNTKQLCSLKVSMHRHG
jgi:hypothetical protein